MAPVIRALSVDDLDALHALEVRAQPVPWSDDQLLLELVNDDATVLAVFDDVSGARALVGHICLRCMLDELWVLNLAVDPAHRRRGHAQNLLNAALVHADNHACTSLWLEVREGNVGARALYAGYGFVEKGRRPRYYPPIPPATEREGALVLSRGP